MSSRTSTTTRFDTSNLPPLPRPDAVTAAELVAFLKHPAREFLRHRIGSWWGVTRNDLEEPAIAIAPALAATLAEMRARPGCRFARMSGSGATCFGVFAADDRRPV